MSEDLSRAKNRAKNATDDDQPEELGVGERGRAIADQALARADRFGPVTDRHASRTARGC